MTCGLLLWSNEVFIDHTLAKQYGFTGEELDFIINYDINDNLHVVWNNPSYWGLR